MIQEMRGTMWKIFISALLLAGSSLIVASDLLPGIFPATVTKFANAGFFIGLTFALISGGFLYQTRLRVHDVRKD